MAKVIDVFEAFGAMKVQPARGWCSDHRCAAFESVRGRPRESCRERKPAENATLQLRAPPLIEGVEHLVVVRVVPKLRNNLRARLDETCVENGLTDFFWIGETEIRKSPAPKPREEGVTLYGADRSDL